jgi:glutamate N-acetyltransferase/amino-acid N-acetyltransferase
VLAAIRASGVTVVPESIELFFGDLRLFRKGCGVLVEAKRLEAVMARNEAKITVKLGMGRKSGRIWCSDLSFDYVRINAHYTT